MKGLLNYIKNIFSLRGMLSKDLSSSMDPSLDFIKENLHLRIISLRNEIPTTGGIALFQCYVELLEIIERLESDDYLETVGFRFKTNSQYNGDVEIDGEIFEEWKMDESVEDDQVLNRILIEQSITLIKEDKKKLIKIIKKIIDEKF